MKKRITLFVTAVILFMLAACGGSEPAATPTKGPLTVWEYEKVCRQGVIDEAAVYEAGTQKVHPILIFQRDSKDTNTYNFEGNTLLELPEPWMVDYEGDVEVKP